MLRSLAGAVVVAVLVLFGGPARAQSNGFAVNLLDVSERGSEWFVLESLDLRGHLRPAIGLVGDLAYRPLVVTDSSGDLKRSIVRNQYFVHAGAGLVLWERLRVSLDVPVMIFADGFDYQVNEIAFRKPAHSAGIGDVRLGLDLRLLGRYGDAITLAIGAQVALPTGDENSYAGDGKVRVMPRAMLAGDIGVFVYGLKLGVDVRTLDRTIAGARVGSDVFFAVAAGLRLANKKLVIGPELFGRSVVTHGAFLDGKSTPLEALLGAHYTFLPDWRAGLGVSTGITEGYGSPQLRGLVSIEWLPAIDTRPADRDHDGIADARDACPDVPGVASSEPMANGCPPDRDGDGIADAQDACPDVPGLISSDPKANGCPPDRDHDGIVDAADACRDVPGVATSDPKTNGCPPDRDHDGILDDQDACPDEAGVASSDPKKNGCPPDPDRDRDGVLNEQDACPDQAGKAQSDPKKNGCPLAVLTAGEIKILEQVKFKTASAEIVRGEGSEDVLIAVQQVLESHPELQKIRVEGHTDSRGSASMNKKLSGARAASVVRWLVSHGISATRLTSEGFGLERPIDSNDTEDGRRNNRRVEFHIDK